MTDNQQLSLHVVLIMLNFIGSIFSALTSKTMKSSSADCLKLLMIVAVDLRSS